MSLEEYIKINNFQNVRKFGKIKGITYYIQEDISDDEDVGIPFMVQEKENKFSVCTSNEALYAIGIFGDELS